MRNPTSLRRALAIGAFAVFGSALAFLVGARVGSKLDHQTRAVSVANVPVQQMQALDELQASPSAVSAEVAHR